MQSYSSYIQSSSAYTCSQTGSLHMRDDKFSLKHLNKSIHVYTRIARWQPLATLGDTPLLPTCLTGTISLPDCRTGVNKITHQHYILEAGPLNFANWKLIGTQQRIKQIPVPFKFLFFKKRNVHSDRNCQSLACKFSFKEEKKY